MNLERAVIRNRHFQQALGWIEYRDSIAQLLGYVASSPGEEQFALGVYDWQRSQRIWPRDGILGPITWRRMRPDLRLVDGPMSRPTDAVRRQVVRPPTTLAENDPTPVPPELAIVSPESTLHIGGVWGDVRCGQTWRASDGARLILSASSYQVVYVLVSTGQVYDQTARGFRGDVTTFPFADAGRRLETGQRLIEIEAYFVLGILCGMSSAVAITALLAPMVRGTYAHRHDIPKWIAITTACLSARSVLKRDAPTLYDKCIDALWFMGKAAAVDVLPRVPASLTAEQIANIVGRIVGQLGERGGNMPVTALYAVLTVLLRVTIGCLGAIPAAAGRAVQEHASQATQIMDVLRENGVGLSRQEAEEIYREIEAHPREIQEALERIARAARE